MLQATQKTEIIYPSSDGEPLAESYLHLYAILTSLEVLKQYLAGCQATVLADQFMFYAQGFPRMRVAPDVMVIFDVAPGGRDNYKIWEEGQVPKVIFEMTSEGTKNKDQEFKKTLYEQLGVSEYWLFDPRGEWISEQLKGYRLEEDTYKLITDGRSEPLQLRLVVEGELIGFYPEDNGEKLLIPDELAEAVREKDTQLQREQQEKEIAQQRLAEMEAKLKQYQERFGELLK